MKLNGLTSPMLTKLGGTSGGTQSKLRSSSDFSGAGISLIEKISSSLHFKFKAVMKLEVNKSKAKRTILLYHSNTYICFSLYRHILNQHRIIFRIVRRYFLL